MLSKKRVLSEADRIKNRLRNNKHQLTQLVAGDELKTLLLPPLWQLMIDYWSEDIRIVDLIVNRTYDFDIKVRDSNGKRVKISVILICNSEVCWPTEDKFAELKLHIITSQGINNEVYWEVHDVFDTILILSQLDENGDPVKLDCPDLVMKGVVALRKVMYKSLQ